MNCTKKEFVDKVRAKYPAKFSWMEPDLGGKYYVFFLNTQEECHKSIAEKRLIASHIWYENNSIAQGGYVVKDDDGLFAQQFTYSGSYAITLPTSVAGNAYHINAIGGGWFNPLENEILERPKEVSVKCCCGSHAVGSNIHSKWCDIKEGS